MNDRLASVLPDTIRGFILLALVTTTVLLTLFAMTRFLLFVFFALVSFFVSGLLSGYLVYEKFMTWLGWTSADE